MGIFSKRDTRLSSRTTFKRQRQRRLLSDSLKRLNDRLSVYYLRFFISFFSMGFIALVIFIINNEYYHIKTIDVFGLERVVEESMRAKVDEFKGKSILVATKSWLQNEIRDKFPEVDRVNVVKEYPDKIILDIQEKQPFAVTIDKSGISLVDSDGFDIGEIEYGGLVYTDTEIKLMENTIDQNDPIVQDRYLKENPDKPGEWEKLPEEDRKVIFEKLKGELNIKTSDFFRIAREKVQQSNFSDLLLVESTEKLVDLNGRIFEESELSAVKRFEEELKINGFRVTKIIYSNSGIRYETEDGKVFLFTHRRDIEAQVKDFRIILIDNLIRRGSTFDLRSSVYSIK